MCVNHSRLQFLSVIATATLLASGVYAIAALAGTLASRTESPGPSTSPTLVRGVSVSETGARGLVVGTRPGVDSDRSSRAPRRLSTTAKPATNPVATGSVATKPVATLAGGGDIGSMAPSDVAAFEALALVVALMRVARFSLEHASFRTTLLVPRLEHPG